MHRTAGGIISGKSPGGGVFYLSQPNICQHWSKRPKKTPPPALFPRNPQSVEKKGTWRQSDLVLVPFYRNYSFFMWYTDIRPNSPLIHRTYLQFKKKLVFYFISNTTNWDYNKPHIMNLHVRSPQSGVNNQLQSLSQELKKLIHVDTFPLLSLHIPSHSNHPSPSLCSAPYPPSTMNPSSSPKLPPIPKHQQCTGNINS